GSPTAATGRPGRDADHRRHPVRPVAVERRRRRRARRLSRREPMTRSLPVGAESPGRAHIGVRTLREDRWWVQPLVTFVLLCLWVAYAMVRTISQSDYFVSQYH